MEAAGFGIALPFGRTVLDAVLELPFLFSIQSTIWLPCAEVEPRVSHDGSRLCSRARL
jgi:hypothetical protein